MKLTPELILGFSGSLLSPRFDNPAPTPQCHLEWWKLCCSEHQLVAIGAPRGHAKTSAITTAYTLASLLFRDKSFCILVSDTYEQAVMFLQDLVGELQNNEPLINTFGVKGFEKSAEHDVIVTLNDGHKFRIIAKGAEQKLRGLKWDGKRPDLIIIDDIENEELVSSKERREKFRYWFYGALLPARSKSGSVRMVGTVLHHDALLERVLPDDRTANCYHDPVKTVCLKAKNGWMSARYRAHDPSFQNILWREMWPEQRLKAERQRYRDMGMADVYSREYLNEPLDDSVAYFRREDFLGMDAEDHKKEKIYYAAIDMALSKESRSDWTVIVVGGVDELGILHIVDVIRARYDSEEALEAMLHTHVRYHPDQFTIEKGLIEKSIGPFLARKMMEKGIFLNLNAQRPSTDKEARARSIQGRMRAGQVKFDMKASWFGDLQAEMLRFPRGRYDDQVDAMAWLGLTLNKITEAPTLKEMEQMEYEEDLMANGMDGIFGGRSYATGY